MEYPHKNIYLVRHGETEWTLNGRHTGTTDIPLTPKGESDAAQMGKRLVNHAFDAVLCSPRRRALVTCQRAGFGNRTKIDADLSEWDYGKYEGLTTDQIRKEFPLWNIFSNGAPGGESVDAVSARADRILAKIHSVKGDVLLFSHGHFLRVIAARWLHLNATEGRLFALSPSSLSILGHERVVPVIVLWNEI